MGGVYQERNYYEVGLWLKKIRKHIRWYGNFPHCWKTHLTLIMYIGANNTPDNTINAMFFNEFHSIISCCNWKWPHFHISWLDCWEETKIMFCLQLQDNNIFFPCISSLRPQPPSPNCGPHLDPVLSQRQPFSQTKHTTFLPRRQEALSSKSRRISNILLSSCRSLHGKLVLPTQYGRSDRDTPPYFPHKFGNESSDR